jgi:hypothetical protein
VKSYTTATGVYPALGKRFVIGTSSSIFIASPILLFLGEKRLRPSLTRAPQPSASAAAG